MQLKLAKNHVNAQQCCNACNSEKTVYQPVASYLVYHNYWNCPTLTELANLLLVAKKSTYIKNMHANDVTKAQPRCQFPRTLANILLPVKP